jgi:UDP-N-acetylglucosamine--N-acetylmuramyl-(pentapeptide) pyrophosphoryl-undecaprenol N-acetylglucosamine transferase
MLFESNAVPGRVVKALAPVVDCVQVQWAVAARRLRAKRVLFSGNPVRAEILAGSPRGARELLGLAPDRRTLLVTGGSQGALALNRALAAALPLLAGAVGRPLGENLQILHVTGPAHLAEALEAARPEGLIYRAVGFTTRMQDAYAAADFVLARAGGSTLAELSALGLPSILVPYPEATDDHQSANAAVLAQAGAAVAVAQAELSPEMLAGLIADFVNRPMRTEAMADRASALGRPDAAESVAAELAAMAGFDVAMGRGRQLRGRRGAFKSLSLDEAA